MSQKSLFDAPVIDRPATNGVALPQTAWRSKARFNPRDYQTAAIDRSFELFGSGSPGVLVVQPTGSGKTVTGTLIAERWLSLGDDHRVMICAHERQLVMQFAEEVEAIIRTRPAIEMANKHAHFQKWQPQIVVSSRQTLMENAKGESRLHQFDNRLNWLLIMDEAHRWKRGLKSCRHILDWFAENPHSRRLGLTATPERGDNVSLSGILPDVALDYRLYDVFGGPSAVNDGWAVPYRQKYVTVQGVQWKNVRDVAGDFSDEDLDRLLSERETLLKMVKPTVDLIGHRRTIVFSPTAMMARRVAEVFCEFRPDCAKSLDGTAPDIERQRVYREHQSGVFQVLSVCGLCREGYNDPGIAAVAVYRPTKSRSLAEQMKGRGCRPLRGLVDGLPDAAARRAAIAASAKPDCLIVDLVGITGMPPVVSTADILANGLPDEVIERANKNIEQNPDADLQEEIRNAKAQLDEEAALRKRQEQERKDRAEAARQARLRADVEYSAQDVEQGVGGSHARERGESKEVWKWGKHKGEPIHKVPSSYLRYFVEQDFNWAMTNMAQRELKRRDAFKAQGQQELRSKLYHAADHSPVAAEECPF